MCMGPLWWSYYQLSEQARRCFAYCTIFPRRHFLYRDELVKLWMAEGFIGSNDRGKDMEDVGLDCFNELASTSFLQLGGKAGKDFLGGKDQGFGSRISFFPQGGRDFLVTTGYRTNFKTEIQKFKFFG